MKIAYLDCFSGISGDMMIGALLDAGLDLPRLEEQVRLLPLQGYRISMRRVTRGGIAAVKFDVEAEEDHPHRRLDDIRKIINESGLDRKVIDRAVSLFERLARAEAAVHGTTPEECEFHEVGAVDSIIDIVGACIAAELLGIEKFICSEINLGGGTVRAMHGTLPVPAPATARLIEGIPVYSSGPRVELTTPTGAVLAAGLSAGFGPLPRMKIISTGYGAGGRELEEPNVLRVIIGESEEAGGSDEVVLIETNIDDMNPELYEHLVDRLLESGALDVYITPVIMKKSRPGSLVSVIGPVSSREALSLVLFRETTTSGLRYGTLQRTKLDRDIIRVDTGLGTVAVKVHALEGRTITVSPEYEDCKKAAREAGVPLREVYDRARAAALAQYGIKG